MSDEAYSLVTALTCICLIAVLWLRWRQGRIMRKILNSLTDEQRAKLNEALKERDKRE